MVNPAIAMGVKQLELPDPLAQYGKIAAIQQAQNQNALAQYQLGAAQRAETRETARMNALAQAGTDEAAIANALLRAGDIKGYADFEKARAERATQALTQQEKRGNILDAALKRSRSFLDTLDPADPDAANKYIAWHEANHADPVIGPELARRGVTADKARASIMAALQQPGGLANLINQSKLGTEKFIELNAPKTVTQDIGGETRVVAIPGLGGPATVVPGSVATKTMAPGEAERLKLQTQQVKLEGQRLGLEGRRVAVLEQNAARDADPAFQQKMEAARTVGKKAAEGDVAAQQALPRVLSRAEEGIRLIDELVGKRDAKGNLIQGSKPHPGFENAVGATWLPGARFVPGTDAAGFMSRFDQIKGASFLEAFESLKGGGAITEKEGAKATDAINRMSIAADEKEFVSAARDLQEVIRKGVENAQRKATGGSPRLPSAPQQPATPSVSPNIDALLKKYQ